MSEAVHWRTDWPAALEAAKKAGLPLMLEFYLEGCPHCARLARETHQDPAVVQALNERFIPVRLEGRAHLDLVKQFQVTGAPTTLLFTPDGQEKQRLVGFQTAAELLQALDNTA